MVSWEIKAKFFGMSPHINELDLLAQKEGFSNIESIQYQSDGTHIVTVNDRGTQQKEFEAKKVE